MELKMKNYRFIAVTVFSFNAIMIQVSPASPVVRPVVGADAAPIQLAANQFRLDSGTNNSLGPCIGACLPGEDRHGINGDAADFAAFSAQRISGLAGVNEIDGFFNAPGSSAIPATANGFGAIFTNAGTAGFFKLDFFDNQNNLLHSGVAPDFVYSSADSFDSLAYLGASFDTASVNPAYITNGGYDLDLHSSSMNTPVANGEFNSGKSLAEADTSESSKILLLCDDSATLPWFTKVICLAQETVSSLTRN